MPTRYNYIGILLYITNCFQNKISQLTIRSNNSKQDTKIQLNKITNKIFTENSISFNGQP